MSQNLWGQVVADAGNNPEPPPPSALVRAEPLESPPVDYPMPADTPPAVSRNDELLRVWLAQQAVKASQSKPWWQSKLIGTGATLIASALAGAAAKWGFDVPADVIANALMIVLFSGGGAVAIIRKWFTHTSLF